MKVVFVPGFTQTASSWTPLFDIADDPDRDALALEVPQRDTFTDAARSLARERAMYVGYSQGGRLCLQLALDHPQVVQRLVLISASPGIADAGERVARRQSDELLALGIERDGVDAFLQRWLALPMFASLAPERAGVDDRRAANTVDTLTQQLRVLGQGSQPSNWGRLGELVMPVLLIVGALDTKYMEIAHQMADLISDVALEVIPDAGHACHLEAPELVAHLVRSWIGSSWTGG
jgi:2-succinyl-6-hydroxy-2,4-cyclohexadiene-1-carboxylate synthase